MQGNAICLIAMRVSAALTIFQGILDQAPVVTPRAGPWGAAGFRVGWCLPSARFASGRYPADARAAAPGALRALTTALRSVTSDHSFVEWPAR